MLKSVRFLNIPLDKFVLKTNHIPKEQIIKAGGGGLSQSTLFSCSICPGPVVVPPFFLPPSNLISPPMNQIKLTSPLFCCDFYSNRVEGQKKHEYFMGRELKTSLGVLVTLSNLSALTPHESNQIDVSLLLLSNIGR